MNDWGSSEWGDDWNALDGTPNGLRGTIRTENGTLNDLHERLERWTERWTVCTERLERRTERWTLCTERLERWTERRTVCTERFSGVVVRFRVCNNSCFFWRFHMNSPAKHFLWKSHLINAYFHLSFRLQLHVQLHGPVCFDNWIFSYIS
jgi:hypothetical protein